jgi:DNA-binding NarL/FixJ family response regulator
MPLRKKGWSTMNDSTGLLSLDRKRVAIYASDPLAAVGIGALLGGLPEFTVLPKRRETEADVIVIVADSVTGDFVETLRSISGRVRAPLVMILSNQRAVDLFVTAELGLASVIPRNEVTAQRLSRVINTVSTGGAELPPDMQALLLAQAVRVQREVLGPRGLNAHGLDNREVDVLRLLAKGLTLGEVADELSYSERTVKNILHALTARLGMRNRTHAVAYAMRVGAI